MSVILFRRDDLDAGRSGREYYEKRLRAWRRSNRGAFAMALVMAAMLAIPFWLWAPLGSFYAGMIVGSFWGMIAWMRDDPPEFIAKWKRGADGERKTARVVKDLGRAGWRAVHDRTTGRGNLDHIAVGPGGVFLLESKNLNGTISVEDGCLTAVYGDARIDSFTNRKLEGAIVRSAIELRDRLASATGLTTWVHAVVVIWGEFPENLVERPYVVYVAGERLGDWLRSQPRRLTDRDANYIWLALQADVVVPRAPSLDAEPA